jgi:hypothetical protein
VDSNLVPIFEQYGVDLVLNGHVSDYERTYPLKGGLVTTTSQGGITYVVTGNANADTAACGSATWEAVQVCATNPGNYSKVTVNGTQLTLQQVSNTGAILDSVSWSKP